MELATSRWAGPSSFVPSDGSGVWFQPDHPYGCHSLKDTSNCFARVILTYRRAQSFLYSLVGIVAPDVPAALNVEHYVDGLPTGSVLHVYDHLPLFICIVEHMLHKLMQQHCDTCQRHDDQDLDFCLGFPYQFSVEPIPRVGSNGAEKILVPPDLDVCCPRCSPDYLLPILLCERTLDPPSAL